MALTREQRYKAEHGMNVDVENVNRRKRGSSTHSRHRWQGGVLVYSINANLGGFLATKIISFCLESLLNYLTSTTLYKLLLLPRLLEKCS